jgi:hypothetical protein
MRIGLLTYRAFHEPILRPLYERLSARHRCLLTGNESELVAFNPNVVILGESVAGRLRNQMPRALFVHTRHGLASKNAEYTCRGASDSDYICVTSPAMRQWYLDRGAKPRRDFWVVGYVQMDPLFHGGPIPPPVSIPQGHKVVLYAPTWNTTLSSAPMLGESASELLGGDRGNITVIIKPHPLIAAKSPEWIETWRKATQANPHVHLIEEADRDVVPFLRWADVLVTDASSVQLEFLAMDRPMILISNPMRFGNKEFEPSGYEWAWRDMGDEIHNVESLPAAIEHALADPRARHAQRAKYRQLLFGDLTDGRAADRIADRVNALRPVLPVAVAMWIAGWPVRRTRGAIRRLSALLGPSRKAPQRPAQPSAGGDQPIAAKPLKGHVQP